MATTGDNQLYAAMSGSRYKMTYPPRASTRDLDKYLAINRLVNLRAAPALCCERRSVACDMLVGLLDRAEKEYGRT